MSIFRMALIVLFSCCSACGSRKTNKQQQELNLQSKERNQADTKLKATLINNTSLDATSREERNYTFNNGKVVPVDPTKPTRFTDPSGNTTTVENGILEFGAGTDKTITEKKESATSASKVAAELQQSQKHEQDIDLKNKDATRTTEREGAGKDVATGVAWICFFILLLLVVAWLIKRRFYDKA